MSTQGILLAAICDFGWGSLGKFRLILDRLSPTDVVLYGEAPINTLAVEMLSEKHTFVDRPPSEADVALVINDPISADAIAALGVPVVYVDSLPYLWATVSEIPAQTSVAAYCAQKFPADRLPVSEPLREWPDIHWIDPIVPMSARHQGGHGTVINLGGLHSHWAGDAVTAYLRLVLVPLVRELKEVERPVSAVCGNLPSDICREVSDILSGCPIIGRCSPYEFEQLLAKADDLITSPGSTTILQAMTLGVPTQLLPPQNLSQILNARLFSVADRPLLSWPESILDLGRIERLWPYGEEETLRYIYGAICSAGTSDAAVGEMTAAIRTTLVSTQAQGVLEIGLGTCGSAQVAELLHKALGGRLHQPAAMTR